MAADSKNGFDTDNGYCTGVPAIEGYYTVTLICHHRQLQNFGDWSNQEHS